MLLYRIWGDGSERLCKIESFFLNRMLHSNSSSISIAPSFSIASSFFLCSLSVRVFFLCSLSLRVRNSPWVTTRLIVTKAATLQRILTTSTESVGLFVQTHQPILRAWNVPSTCPPIEQELVEQGRLLLLALATFVNDGDRSVGARPARPKTSTLIFIWRQE